MSEKKETFNLCSDWEWMRDTYFSTWELIAKTLTKAKTWKIKIVIDLEIDNHIMSLEKMIRIFMTKSKEKDIKITMILTINTCKFPTHTP